MFKRFCELYPVLLHEAGPNPPHHRVWGASCTLDTVSDKTQLAVGKNIQMALNWDDEELEVAPLSVLA